MQQLVHAVDLRLGHDVLDLVADTVVVGDVLDVADHAQGHRHVRALHVGERHVQADVVGVGVVHEDVVLGEAALADAHGADLLAVVDQAAVAVLAEDHLLAVVQDDRMVRLDGRIGQGLVRAVVEDHAVRQHLHHGAAVVQGGRRHDLFVELELHVQRAGEEGALGAQHERTRVERVLHGAVGGCLRDGSELGGRRILTLGVNK